MTARQIEAYDFAAIEARWRDYWKERGFFKVDTASRENTFYYLNMFPYPSGYLHVGHGRNYIIGDVVTRVKKMRGYNVLNPMGWDAFGLPAENAAIENASHPRDYTFANINSSREQFRAWGVVFDWDREVTTCKPDYYKWTQWLFLQLYKRGLAYKKTASVNYCPGCDTVLANEQIVAGRCERCGTLPEKKELAQWFFKITDYADRLLDDLDKLTEWPENVVKMQENWIGRSTGAEVVFRTGAGDEIPVFTTRPDTLWGATFMVLAPEHPLVEKLTSDAQRAAVVDYRRKAERETEIDRLSTEREKTGVFTGGHAVNPVNGAKIPVWIADYVLMTYGTGAIMAVPAHDERDFAFALKFGLPILPVIERADGRVRSVVPDGAATADFAGALCAAGIRFEEGHGEIIVEPALDQVDDYLEIAQAHVERGRWIEIVGARWAFVFSDGVIVWDGLDAENEILNRCRLLAPGLDARTVMELLWRREENRNLLYHADFGTMINSGDFTGTPGDRALSEVIAWLEENGIGEGTVNYRLHDWLISRQRYWGAPIPIVYCDRCGAVPVPEDDLPVSLPQIDRLIGKMGLADVPEFIETTCPNCGAPARRDTDTMDTFVDSSWYYLRFINPQDDEHPFVTEDVNRWLPVDQYVGGVEHAILHLLYSRFITKALFDVGLVGFEEPFARLFTQGMVCHPAYRCPEHGWQYPDKVGDSAVCPKCGGPLQVSSFKMSKSKRNVVDPTALIETYGADTERLYTMFMGPPDRDIDWSDEGVRGAFRFLNRVWALVVGNVERLDRPGAGVDAPALTEVELALWRRYHRTVKKVTGDVEGRFSFNTAVAAIMELTNDLGRAVDEEVDPALLRQVVDGLILLLSPFCPFIAEELWRRVGHEAAILEQSWPIYDEDALEDKMVEIPVQINGKVRARVTVPADDAEDPEVVKAAALADPGIVERLAGKELVKAIAIPGKMVSLVVK